MTEPDPARTIPPWLDRMLDGLVWAVSLGFLIIFALGSVGVGLWERVIICVFGFFLPFFMVGTMMILVRRIIATK